MTGQTCTYYLIIGTLETPFFMKTLLNVSEIETLTLLQNVVKVYPTFVKIIQFHEPILIQQKGYEKQNKSLVISHDKSMYDSTRRAKTIISDIVLCNHFDYFVTLTFATHRHDIAYNKKRLTKWLNKQQTRYGKFRYIIVPELHKDGAVHFHALFGGYKGKIVQANTKQKQTYNIKSYRLGYSTLKIINQNPTDIKKVSNYIKKYITKDFIQTTNKKRFWTSTGLIRPQKLHNVTVSELVPDNHFKTDHFTIHTIDSTLESLTKQGKIIL